MATKDLLTVAERATIRRMRAEGATWKEIADALRVSVATARHHARDTAAPRRRFGRKLP